MRFAGAPQIASFLGDSPDYGALAQAGMNAASKERQSATYSRANTHVAGLDAMAQVRAAEHQARGIKASGQAQASATRAAGLSNMIGSIAGGVGNIDFGGSGGPSSLWDNDPYSSTLDTTKSTPTFRYYTHDGANDW